MIKVLVVDDSPVMRELLSYIINSDSKLQVIGVATNGEEAIKAAKELRPDIITMDLHMPKMDGVEATRIIMETCPVPIVIVSGNNKVTEINYFFQLLEAGAITVLLRPPGIGHKEHIKESAKLVKTLRLMSEVKVVRRISRQPAKLAFTNKSFNKNSTDLNSAAEIVAIGASTGGPQALQLIISGLPKNLPFPILIVQHIAPGFIQGFAEWLSKSSGLPVRVAVNGEKLLSGVCYIAPDGFHMGVGYNSQIVLSSHEPENGLRPSVAFLFRTVSQIYGSKAIGILLSGMGKDGADELKIMRDNNAITIAQDKNSSVVHGMPGEAIKINAANFVLSPEKISEYLSEIANK